MRPQPFGGPHAGGAVVTDDRTTVDGSIAIDNNAADNNITTGDNIATGTAIDDGDTIDDGDRVVLLDERHQPCGTAPRIAVHGTDTPLHLAFSCYLFDPDGRLLITRRALGKRTWPGVWTNSCCGHPRPGEDVATAVSRRVEQELGLGLADLRCALPDFAYRATAADGLVENEVCPVYVARAVTDPDPDPAEVVEWQWVAWEDYRQVAVAAPWAISPWSASQMAAFPAAHPLSTAGPAV